MRVTVVVGNTINFLRSQLIFVMSIKEAEHDHSSKQFVPLKVTQRSNISAFTLMSKVEILFSFLLLEVLTY